jgi:phosphoserine phosphatase RsbU/P
LRPLNKISEQSLRFIFVLIAIYCGIISGIPLFKAAVTERLTIDGSIKSFEDSDSGVRLEFIVPGGPSDKAGLKAGDTVIAINGKKVTDSRTLQYELSQLPDEYNALYTVIRSQTVFETIVIVEKYFHLIFFIFSALGFSFLIIGFLVGYSKPKELISQIFFFLGCSASLGLILYGGVWYYVGLYPLYYINYEFGLTMFYPLFLHFFMIYPKKYEFKHRKLIIISVYSYTIIISCLLIFVNFDSSIFIIELIKQIISYSPIIFLISAIVLFVKTYLKITDKNLKKPFKIIVYGLLLGGIGLFYYFFIFTPFISNHSANMNYLLRVPAILVMAIPLSFGYSIFKYRILDTEFIIKKGIVFGIVSSFIAVCYLIFAYLLETFVLVQFQGNKLLLYIALMYLFIITFNHVNKGAKKFVDEKFYKNRYNYRKALLKFSEDLPYINNLREAIIKLDNTLKDTMGVNDINFFIYDEAYKKLISGEKHLPGKRIDDNYLLKKEIFEHLFENNKEAVFLYPVNLNELNLNDEQKVFIENEKIVLSVPIYIRDKIIGTINFGEKPDNEAYSDEDVDLLETLASHTAVMFENTRLKTEEVNRKMIEEELLIAKNIQMGLLPKEHQLIEGLDISGSIYPARIIGGDFYDIIKLGDKKLLLIIADVSGNGIPAALNMAKVQAIIRFASKLFKYPKDILFEVNKQVYKKFEKGSFVTMILALFDLNTNKVKIARAGHNPMIYSNNGKLTIIKSKGIGVGLESESIFNNNLEEIEIDIPGNSFFLFYTDGLNEAMNDKREEFGMERILSLAENYKNEKAGIIHRQLIDSVNYFRKETEQNDDISVVVVKVDK